MNPRCAQTAVRKLLWGLGASLLLVAAALFTTVPDHTYLLPTAWTCLSLQADYARGLPARIKLLNVLYSAGICAVLSVTGGVTGTVLAALAVGPLLYLSLRLPTVPWPEALTHAASTSPTPPFRKAP